MKTKFTGGPAFPVPDNPNANGMALRDWFAGLAMQAMVAGYRTQHDNEEGYGNLGRGFSEPNLEVLEDFSVEAETAYGIADAMLEARES